MSDSRSSLIGPLYSKVALKLLNVPRRVETISQTPIELLLAATVPKSIFNDFVLVIASLSLDPMIVKSMSKPLSFSTISG